jgi:ribosomal protein L37AE/L43A
MADQMQLAMGLAVLGLGCAAGVRVLRVWLAQAHDRQAMSCRHCGHDLRATPVTGGIGVCGECGASFARFEH